MASEPENIIRFKTMAAPILGALYAVHPADIPRDSSGIASNQVLDESDEDLFDDTVSYLIENGYLTTTSGGGFIRLNAKSWEVLQKPDPLKPKETLGSQLVKVAKDAGAAGAKGAASKAGAAALAALAQAINL
jgi:hypothetical protein